MAAPIDTIAEPTSEQRRITICHLNHHCLEKVFRYLNLTDLTNVAESNVYLAGIACNFFVLKYSTMKYHCYGTEMGDDTFMLLLHHFGEYIQILHVDFSHHADRDRILFDAITKHCKATVTELVFGGLHNTIIPDQPFPKVTKLNLINNIGRFAVNQSILQLNKWFPNVNALQIQNVSNFWKIFPITKCESLKHFAIYNFPERDTKDTVQKMAQFLCANPQLTGLEMDEISEENMQVFVEYAPKQLPNVERLGIVSPHPYPFGPIEFANLKELKLSFYRNHMDIFERLPSTLEILELYPGKLTTSALDFILKCRQNLTKLTLVTSDAIKPEQMEKIAREMQALAEIHIYQQVYQPIDLKIPTGFDSFFLYNQRMKTISLKYETSSWDSNDQEYKGEVENAQNFLQTINKRSMFNWRMGHKLAPNDHYRSRMLFISLFLITFERSNNYLR